MIEQTSGRVRPPLFLDHRSTDEFAPRPHSPADLQTIERVFEGVDDAHRRTGRSATQIVSDRVGTAIGLRELNRQWGAEYFEIPAEATVDASIAEEVFASGDVVIDVQTHFVAPHSSEFWNAGLAVYREHAPDWWTEMDDIVERNLAEYITNVFLECETAVAVLTSGPGVDENRTLWNDEMAATRELIDHLAGQGRMLNHAVVHADLPQEIEAMDEALELYRPVGWKVYTPGRPGADGWVGGWMLDDEEVGVPFLERARELGTTLICSHKGLSGFVDDASPRDIGPAARLFPDLDFVVYHSGYEFPLDDEENEGPYRDETADFGVNRLLRSLDDAGLAPGANVYAELGSTWFGLVRRPREAAHVLGKLIDRLGEDRVLWGTDSIWYGSAQPLIDAFRTFQIPDDMCERYGYSKLTPAIKDKILGQSAASLYGIDLERARRMAAADDLAWARAALTDVKTNGFDALR
jgi:predicted TIM-barrel fold metal-dependent hydrolase